MSYTLRDLPLPVKVVATVFLMAVGTGYLSAMVQIHMQDSKSGKPMPTIDDVVMKFTGKKWFDGPPPPPVSQLEILIMGPVEGAPWNGAGSMAPAFFHKDGGEYNRLVKENPADKAQIDAERNGERELFRWWINAKDDAKDDRKTMYDDDKCVIPADKAKALEQISDDFKNADGSFKIKTLIDQRCARCHAEGASEHRYPLEKYEHLARYMTVPPVPAVPPGGGWAKVSEPMSVEKLTQSTHAHLLSFSMLFSLTGVIFAFSSWPKWMRVIGGPWVVLAVFADVACWWLARMCDQWGPFFAQAVIYTGMAAGAGLFGQIVLSLFDLYGWKGKIVLAGLMLLGAGVVIAVFLNRVEPALKEKEKQLQAKNDDKKNKDKKNGEPAKKPADGKKVEPPKKDEPKKVEVPKSGSPLDLVLTFPVKMDGMQPAPTELPFKREKGGMVPAFFNRDDGEVRFKMVMKEGTEEEKKRLTAERLSELAAVQAWVKVADPQRKAAYDSDAFEFDLKGQPLTDEYRNGAKVKVRSILTNRCARCHVAGGDNEDALLDTYDNILKSLAPAKDAANNNGTNPAPAPEPALAPMPKVVAPIPAAKDD